MARKRKATVPPPVPTDVVRLILRLVDFEVFVAADAHLQRYMVQNDMLQHPQYAFVWALRQGRFWIARRLQQTYGLTVSTSVRKLMPVPPPRALVQNATVYDQVMRGHVASALRCSEAVDNDELERALKKFIDADRRCPNAWQLVDKWPSLHFSFIYFSVKAGRCDLLRQSRHTRKLNICSSAIGWCLNGGKSQLRTLKCLWRLGARYDLACLSYVPPVQLDGAETMRWCIQHNFHHQRHFMATALEHAVMFRDLETLQCAVPYVAGEALEELCIVAATNERTDCLRFLLQHGS